MHYNEHNRIQSFGGIIRHHNPAYDGIVNAGFVHHGSDSPVLRFNQHQYNNGNTIREESISMTTFGKENVVRRNGQILDAYNLQNPNWKKILKFISENNDRNCELQFVVQPAKPTASPESDFEKTQNA